MGMKPSQIASKLRQIASAIDNSKNPRQDLVAQDLRRVIIAVGDKYRVEDPEYFGGLTEASVEDIQGLGFVPVDAPVLQADGDPSVIVIAHNGEWKAIRFD